MSDVYSDEEREAIQNYAGEITVVKRGKSAFPIDGSGNWKSGAERNKRIKDRVRKFELSKERDNKIVTMVEAGYTISDIARETGLTRKAVKARMQRLKLVRDDS